MARPLRRRRAPSPRTAGLRRFGAAVGGVLATAGLGQVFRMVLGPDPSWTVLGLLLGGLGAICIGSFALQLHRNGGEIRTSAQREQHRAQRAARRAPRAAPEGRRRRRILYGGLGALAVAAMAVIVLDDPPMDAGALREAGFGVTLPPSSRCIELADQVVIEGQVGGRCSLADGTDVVVEVVPCVDGTLVLAAGSGADAVHGRVGGRWERGWTPAC